MRVRNTPLSLSEQFVPQRQHTIYYFPTPWQSIKMGELGTSLLLLGGRGGTVHAIRSYFMSPCVTHTSGTVPPINTVCFNCSCQCNQLFLDHPAASNTGGTMLRFLVWKPFAPSLPWFFLSA